MKIPKNIEKITATYGNSTGVRWAILLFAMAFFILIVYPSLFISQKTYELGDIATSDIKAPRNFFIENSTATETSRENAQKNVLTVYDFDASLLERIKSRISTAFNLMRSVELEVRSQIEETYGVDQAQAILGTLLENAYLKAQQEFEQALGLTVNDEAFRILMNARFDLNISTNLTEIITELLEPGIVSNQGHPFKRSGQRHCSTGCGDQRGNNRS